MIPEKSLNEANPANTYICSVRAEAASEIAATAPAARWRHTALGLMFWLTEKRFPGSYFALIRARRP